MICRSCRATFRVVAVAVAVTAAGSAGPAHAQLGDVFVSGFVSQGYFNTSGNEYLIDGSEKGSAEFNEAALVFYSLPSDRVRIGAQLFARDFGNIGNNAVIVDWAFGDYRWKEALGFRIGKVRMPWGLYNQVRDIDIARDQVFLPQSLYNEDLRDFLLAYEGAGAYGRIDLDEAGELNYELWGGTFNVPDPTRGFWRDLFDSVGRSVIPALEVLYGGTGDGATAQVTSNGVRDPMASFPWAFGGGAFWETPIDGLRLGVTGLRTRVEGSVNLLYDVVIDSVATGASERFETSLPARIEFDVDVLATASVEYVNDRWTLAAEYEYEKIENDEGDGWYGLVSYGVTDRLALTSYYSETYGDRNNRSGRGSAIRPVAWQKDFAIGARIDLTDNWRVKYEHHVIDGLLGLLDSSDDGPPVDPGDFERRWNYFALKSTFHF